MKRIYLLRKIGVYVCAAWWINIILLLTPMQSKYLWIAFALLSVAVIVIAIAKVYLEKRLTNETETPLR